MGYNLQLENADLEQCASDFDVHTDHLGTGEVADSESVGLGWEPQFCISNQLPGDTDTACVQITVEQPGSPAQELFSTMDRRPPPTDQINLWVTLSAWLLCKSCGTLEWELSRSCLTEWNAWVCSFSLSGGALEAVPRPWTRVWSTELGSLRSSALEK